MLLAQAAGCWPAPRAPGGAATAALPGAPSPPCSWGGDWGESGFFRLSVASEHPAGTCGVYQAASYPVKKGDSNPEPLEVCGYFGWKDCPARNTCVCDASFFGLFCFPWSWGCEANSAAAA